MPDIEEHITEGWVVVGCTARIDGCTARFSSHMAAFEACMRIRQPRWRPHGCDTHFEDVDHPTFALLCAQHAERAQCP